MSLEIRPRERIPAARGPSAQRALLIVLCSCVVLVVGMAAAVNLAVPLLTADPLVSSAPALLWIVDGYLVVFACLVIPGGAAGDRFGRKGVLLAGLALFAGGALLSACAPSVVVLLIGRAVTGIGAAAVLPNTLAILLHAVPATRRAATIATWASMTGIGGVAGNLGGGAILTTGSWRWLFAAGAPLAAILAALSVWVVPVSARHARRLDPIGTVLLITASVALLSAIVEAPESGWSSPLVLAGFACAAVLFTAWVVVESIVREPLLDPRLFRIPVLRSACLGMVTVFFGMFALFYVNASFLQYVLGFGTLRTGLAILPLTVPIVIGAPRVGHLVRWIGRDGTVASAFVFVGGGLLGLSTVGAGTSYAVYALWLVVTGVGVTFALPTLSGVIAGSLPPEQAGAATGLQATTREFGSALGVAIVGTVLTARFSASLPPMGGDRPRPHTVDAALAVAGPGRAGEVVAAFAGAADTAFRVIGLIVLALGALVVTETLLSRRATSSPGA